MTKKLEQIIKEIDELEEVAARVCRFHERGECIAAKLFEDLQNSQRILLEEAIEEAVK